MPQYKLSLSPCVLQINWKPRFCFLLRLQLIDYVAWHGDRARAEDERNLTCLKFDYVYKKVLSIIMTPNKCTKNKFNDESKDTYFIEDLYV
jgi:hypothetical protein